MNEIIKPLISSSLKEQVINEIIVLSCNYAGCGSADSWPKFTP
jgi:hypothetical protein